MAGFRFLDKRVLAMAALCSFAALVTLPRATLAEDLPWKQAQSDRGYIPDDGPRDISPDGPRNDAPRYDTPPKRYDPPPQRYDPPPQRYDPPPQDSYSRRPPADDRGQVTDQEYSSNEITEAGGNFFGSVSVGLAKVVEHTFKSQGRPNGYILGEEASGAIIAGLRYGEGTLYTKSAGRHKVFWQGPSIGYDFGASGAKTMILVYNLYGPDDVYRNYGGVAGSAFFIGGVGVTFLSRDHVKLAPIVSGVGLRLGANIGYLKFTRAPTWNPF